MGDGFEVETLVNIRVPRAGLKVTEVPSFEHSRIHGVSNLNAVSDGLRVLRTILTERRLSQQATALPCTTASVPESNELRRQTADDLAGVRDPLDDLSFEVLG